MGQKTKDNAAPEQDAAKPDAAPAADQNQAGQPGADSDKPAAKAYDEAYIKELLTRNGLKTAWVLAGDHICFDEKHARHMAGEGFDSLPTISAE